MNVKVDSAGTLPSGGNGWLGIPAALVAITSNFHYFVARRPSTPLRVLSLIAISAAMRARGGDLKQEARQAMIELMELGALMNDRFDGDAYDAAAIRESMAWFAGSPYRETVWEYARRLRRLERTRPRHDDGFDAVKRYREQVNHISLAALWAIGRDQPLALSEMDLERETDLRMLFEMVMLLQVIDDVTDVSQDRARHLPSFATGPEVSAESLRGLVAAYGRERRLCLDRNFCLWLALRALAACARGWIAFRMTGFTMKRGNRQPPELR